VFLIAIIWRIVSFKYTHLVERLQLLTLIIIGEGIIGMVKSVSCITKGQTSLSANEVGTVAAAVILLVRTISPTTQTHEPNPTLSTSSTASTSTSSPQTASAPCANNSGPSYTIPFTWRFSSASKATRP
jgi:hypothetical protein